MSELFAFAGNSPLNWGFPQDLDSESMVNLVAHWDHAFPSKVTTAGQGKKKSTSTTGERGRESSWVDALESWLATVAQRASRQEFFFECLAWCHILPSLANELPAAPWSELLETMVDIAGAAQELSALDHPLQQTLQAGELGLTLGYLFPELQSCRQLTKASQAAISTGTVDLLDGEGLPHVSDLPIFRLLLASWTRCSFISEAMEDDCFSVEARGQFEWAVRQAICLSRKDKSQLFTVPATNESWNDWCEHPLEAAGNDVDWLLASKLVFKSKQKSRHRQRFQHVEQLDLPRPPIHSEWSEFSVMRTNWRNSGHQLAVSYDQPTMTTELIRRGQTLWRGEWITKITIDSKPVTFPEHWDVTCWFSDKDIDYLELELELDSGWRIQRQLLLAREDQFLFQADVLLGNTEAQIDYQTRLPLVSETTYHPAAKTHEGTLTAADQDSLVLPLSCPEWKSEPSTCQLQQVDGGLEYQSQANARNLYAPLFIDLSKSGKRKPFTWRRLTVGQCLESQSDDIAVGYRVQIGSRQWCIYRSLDPPTSRTFLGQNVTSEFVVGRFSRSGEVEQLVEIE